MSRFSRKLSCMIRVSLVLTLITGGTLSAAQTVTYFHNDALGTPLLATNANGNVVWKENYRPYGARLNNQSAATSNTIGYAGKPFDASTGLSYLGARYYDPVLGRFMGVDPADVRVGDVHSINRYAYANNNPYKYVDPDGRSPALAIEVGVPLLIGGAIYYSFQAPEKQQAMRASLARLMGSLSRSESSNEQGGNNETTGGVNDEASGKDILAPGGKAIGEKGTSKDVRVLPGGLAEAQDLFDRATKGGKVVDNPGYRGKGKLVEIPGGGTVGLRPESKSGGPAIDVNVPGVPYDKIHFGKQ